MANIFLASQNKPSSPGFIPGSYAPSGGQFGGEVGLAPRKKPITSSPLENQYKMYNGAVEQQARDYGDILGGYKNLLSSSQASNPILKPETYTPERFAYSPTANSSASLANLKALTSTGGISDAEASDIRERGISPIRSIYSSANRDIERNRTLKGGYSPGYGAVKAKMARELSDAIGNQITSVNADIAGKRQQGRLTAGTGYASAAGAENALASEYGAKNAETANEASRFNLQLPLEYGKYNQGTTGQQANILDAMRSLYGTTPALSSLFGNQAMSAAQLQNLIGQQGNQNNLEQIRSILGGLR